MPLHREREAGARRARERPRSVRPARAPRPRGRAPSVCTPCECSEFTMTRSLPASRVQHAAGRRARLRAPVRTARRAAPPCPRDDRASPGTSCTFCQSVPPKATFISWKPRQIAEQRQAGLDDVRNQRQRRRVAMRIVQRAGVARRPRVAMRLDVRGAAGQQHAVERSPAARRRSSASPSDGISTGIASARLGHGGDVLLADAVEGVLADQPAIRGNADQRFAATTRLKS